MKSMLKTGAAMALGTTMMMAAGSAGLAQELAAAPGFDPAAGTIKLGVLTVESGPLARSGRTFTQGLRLAIDAANANGGIAGKYKVELEVRDTQFNPATAIQLFQEIAPDVTMFAQTVGTPIVGALAPVVEENQIVFSPTSLDARWVVEEYMLTVGAPYQIEMINALDWYVKSHGEPDAKICAGAIRNPTGDAAMEGAKIGAEALGVTLAAEAQYQPGELDLTAYVRQFMQAECDAILMGVYPTETGPLLAAAKQLGYAPDWMVFSIGFSADFLADATLKPLLEADNFFVAAQGTDWDDTTSPGMVQLRKDREEFDPDMPMEFLTLHGYAQGRTVVALLEAAVEAGDLSREGMFAALNGLGEVDLEGLFGNWTYGPVAERKFPSTSSIFRVDPSIAGGLRGVAVNYASEAAASYTYGQ